MDKMRIKLLNKEGAVISDRLITQSAELTKGPSEVYKDPIVVEFNLSSKEEVKLCQEWLGRISGELPLESPKKGKKGAYKKKIALLDKEPVKELYHTAFAKCKTQDELITYLREMGFVFLTYQFIQDFKIPIKLREKHSTYQFMVRSVKIAKNMKADKYDHQLAIGMRIVGTRVPQVKVYLYGKFLKSIIMAWGKGSDRTLQKQEFLIFPTYMTEDERIKYSIEHRKLKLNPKAKPSKLYNRWKEHIRIR